MIVFRCFESVSRDAMVSDMAALFKSEGKAFEYWGWSHEPFLGFFIRKKLQEKKQERPHIFLVI